jgi:peroxiredoxin
MSMKKISFYAFFIILILLYSFSLRAQPSKDDLLSRAGIRPVKGSPKAPSFSLEDLKGLKCELRNFNGKVVFLNFWATWCGPCKEEMPSMEALHQQFKEKNFVFLTISVDYEGVKPVKEFIEKHRYTFPVLVDPECQILDLYQVKGLPTTIVIDKKGTMIGKAVGPKNWKSSEVIYLVNHLIK